MSASGPSGPLVSSSELKAHSDQAIGIVGCLSCVDPHAANNFFKGHLPKLLSTF